MKNITFFEFLSDGSEVHGVRMSNDGGGHVSFECVNEHEALALSAALTNLVYDFTAMGGAFDGARTDRRAAGLTPVATPNSVIGFVPQALQLRDPTLQECADMAEWHSEHCLAHGITRQDPAKYGKAIVDAVKVVMFCDGVPT